MELSWSTFLLEIINFLVLVWILKRFLYKPVLEVIGRRRESIEQTLREAGEEREASEVLQLQYEKRLADWEQEKEIARIALQRDVESERRQRLEALAGELKEERKKAQVLAEKELRETERRLQTQALDLGANFATRLLSRLAGPELEAKLIEAALQDLAALPVAQRQRLHQAWQRGDALVEVTSAYPLDEPRQGALEKVLASVVGGDVACRYREDPELIGGMRLRLGSWVLHANLRNELKSFAEAGRE